MLGFMAKKASTAVRLLQWKSSAGMAAAGPHTAPRRFPCVPANPAPVLTQQKQESPKARAQLAAVLRELHLPMSPTRCSPAERPRPGTHREPPGNAQLRSCPPTCKTQTQKPGQTSQWTFLLMVIPPRGCSRRQSLQQVLSSQSNTGSWWSSAGHRSHPSTTAQSSSHQLVLQNTWVMRESQSLESRPSPCQFWHFPHQSTRNKSHLLPRWFTGITKLPCTRGSWPRWHSQVTVKSSAGSKTAQSQEDREY